MALDALTDLALSFFGEAALEALARALRIKSQKGKRLLAVSLAVCFLVVLFLLYFPLLVL